jgi:hypothetical protein
MDNHCMFTCYKLFFLLFCMAPRPATTPPLKLVWVQEYCSLFGWLVADGWCWFVLREEYCWLVAGGWFVLREKYWWLVADKPSEQGVGVEWSLLFHISTQYYCVTSRPKA